MKLVRTLLTLFLAPTLSHATEEIEMIGAYRFNEGLSTVIVDGKHGYVDTRGTLAIPANYASASGMMNGFAVVAYENELRYIDRNGTLLNEKPAAFRLTTHPQSPLDNFWEADSTGTAKWGYKDQEGNVVMEPRYDYTGFFSEGLAAFSIADETMPVVGRRNGYLDLDGNVVIPPTFQVASEFSEGLAKVIQDYRHYFINRKGERAFAGDFSFAFDFSEGLAAVDVSPERDQGLNTVRRGLWGFVDKSGALIIPAIYQEARPFEEGFARVMQDDKWGIINHRGEDVVAPRYLEIGEISEGMAGVRMETDENHSKWGFINMQGELIVPAQFDQVRSFSEGFAMVRIGGKRGYIDHTGAYLWEPSE